MMSILKQRLKSSRVTFETLIDNIFEDEYSLYRVGYFEYPEGNFPADTFYYSKEELENKFHKSKLPDLGKIGFVNRIARGGPFLLTPVGEQYVEAMENEDNIIKELIKRIQVLFYRIDDNVYPYWIILYLMNKFDVLTNELIEKILSLPLEQLLDYENFTLEMFNGIEILGNPHASYIFSYLKATNLCYEDTRDGEKVLLIKEEYHDYVNTILMGYPAVFENDDEYRDLYCSKVDDQKIFNLLFTNKSEKDNRDLMLDLALVNIDKDDSIKEKLENIIDGNKVFTDDIETLESIVASIYTGHHVILYGPVGTGKTELVRTVTSEIFGSKLDIITAGEDWDSPDYLIGSYKLSEGELKYIKGPLINAIEGNYYLLMQSIINAYKLEDVKLCKYNWLLIDEINRGDVNRYLSNLMTALEPLRDNLSKKDLEDKYMIVYDTDNDGYEDYVIMPKSFRIIGTMNTYDKNVLYKLPFALKGRRFALIGINPPNDINREIQIINKVLMEEGLVFDSNDAIISLLKEFMADIRHTSFRIGTAVFIDVARMALELKSIDHELANDKVIDLALSIKFIPLLDDLPIYMQEEIQELLDEKGFSVSKEKLNELIGEFEI